MEAQTKKNLIVWGIIILVVLNLSSLGTIWYHRYNFKRDILNRDNIERRMPRDGTRGSRQGQRSIYYLSRDLNLSEEQQGQFNAIWEQHLEQRTNIAQEMSMNRKEMIKIMSLPEVDTSRYKELAGLQAELILLMDKAMMDMNLELRQVLNNDQLPLFLNKIGQMNQRRHGMSPEYGRKGSK